MASRKQRFDDEWDDDYEKPDGKRRQKARKSNRKGRRPRPCSEEQETGDAFDAFEEEEGSATETATEAVAEEQAMLLAKMEEELMNHSLDLNRDDWV